MAKTRTIGGRGHASVGGVGLAGVGLVVGALLACGPGEGEPEAEPCVEQYAVAGDEEYETLDPEAAAEQLEGVWTSTNGASPGGIPQVHLVLVAGDPPDSIGACGDRRYVDLPMEAYVWTSDGNLDTALGGELRLEQTGDDVDSRLLLTTTIESAVPASDLAGLLLEQVVDSGFPLRLGVSLDYRTGAPTKVALVEYDEARGSYTSLYEWTTLDRVQ